MAEKCSRMKGEVGEMAAGDRLTPSLDEIQRCLDQNLGVDNACVRWLLNKYTVACRAIERWNEKPMGPPYTSCPGTKTHPSPNPAVARPEVDHPFTSPSRCAYLWDDTHRDAWRRGMGKSIEVIAGLLKAETLTVAQKALLEHVQVLIQEIADGGPNPERKA